jgi:hypothetical protein
MFLGPLGFPTFVFLSMGFCNSDSNLDFLEWDAALKQAEMASQFMSCKCSWTGDWGSVPGKWENWEK